jgi:hypothetical protein
MSDYTLTLIGAVSSRSFYDYLYLMFLRSITGLGEMPRHGAPRRFGCALGAAFTQWCFASALYRLISRKKADCC